jgi:hypothetical protein
MGWRLQQRYAGGDLAGAEALDDSFVAVRLQRARDPARCQQLDRTEGNREYTESEACIFVVHATLRSRRCSVDGMNLAAAGPFLHFLRPLYIDADQYRRWRLARPAQIIVGRWARVGSFAVTSA